MEFQEIANKIIQLKEDDLVLRNKLIRLKTLDQGYNSEMEKMHIRNAKILNEIFNEIGYPTKNKVGEKASNAAWLIIQHSIGQPDFMKKCLFFLEKAVEKQETNPKNLAYLSDRINTLEGNHQLYGTSFDWDENGVLNPTKYDDVLKVNQRRKLLGWNTIEEQTKIIRKQASLENQMPPNDFEKRQGEYNEWRKKVGWIK